LKLLKKRHAWKIEVYLALFEMLQFRQRGHRMDDAFILQNWDKLSPEIQQALTILEFYPTSKTHHDIRKDVMNPNIMPSMAMAALPQGCLLLSPTLAINQNVEGKKE
jgi:hypothetical protein